MPEVVHDVLISSRPEAYKSATVRQKPSNTFIIYHITHACVVIPAEVS